MRATLRLSSPAWFAHPMITSSIVAGSIDARSTAARMTRAARSSARTVARAPPARPTGVRAADTMKASLMRLAQMLVESDELEVEWPPVDSGAWRRDPVRELGGLDDAACHQRLNEGIVLLRRKPPVATGVPRVLAHHFTARADVVTGEVSDGAMECLVGQREAERQAGPGDMAVPPIDTSLHLRDVVVAKPLVQGRERRYLSVHELAVSDFGDGVCRVGEHVVVFELRFSETTFEATGEVGGGVRRHVRAEQVKRHAVMEIEIPLNCGEVDDPEVAGVIGVLDLRRCHHIGRSL